MPDRQASVTSAGVWHPTSRRATAPGFYLGVPEPGWLARTDAPLFVSQRRLAGRRRLPLATCSWALDSGGFTELSLYGEWRTTPGAYVAAIWRYATEIRRLDWAAPMDWMCEPSMLARTGLTVPQHQRRTVNNLLTLRTLAPDLPIIPVLQGWTLSDYLRCLDLYAASGVDLTAEPLVGLGSVCRRQHLQTIGAIVERLASMGLRLHAFGVKVAGYDLYGHRLASLDSMAWSFRARRSAPMPGHRHRTCANCLSFALGWRAGLLDRPARGAVIAA
jgi:hypothetical protein